jgi:hypothetical protein
MRTRLQKLLSALALSGLLGATACTDGYGRYDPVATGLLGAGVGAAAGLAIGAAATRPSRNHYHAPPPRYGWGYGRPVYGPRYGWGYGYRPGWGHRPSYW